MALFCYLCHVDNALDPQGPFSQVVPRVVIEEVNHEVKKAEARPNKWGQYLSFTVEEKAKVVRYVSTNGVASHARLNTEALHLSLSKPKFAACVPSSKFTLRHLQSKI